MNQLLQSIPESGIRAIFNRAQEIERLGQKVWHLEIGRPDWQLPPGASSGLNDAVEQGYIHYIANRGLIELREAIAQDNQSFCGATIDPEKDIVVTLGASEGLAMCGLGLLEKGDEVIIFEPAWPHYKAIVNMVGAKPVCVSLPLENGFLITEEILKQHITPKTKMIVVNSPSNPTGSLQSKEALLSIARYAEEKGIYVVSDEVYRDFVYGPKATSLSEIMKDSPWLIQLHSFSKSYAMTGWRIGYVLAKPEITKVLNRVHQYLTVCGVSFAQKAATEVLRHPDRENYLSQMKEAFNKRRLIWEEHLKGHERFKMVSPAGAFYLFPEIHFQNMTGHEFCAYMLDEHQIAMVPGEIFGESFVHHVRISYGGSEETQLMAAQTIKKVLDA